MRGVQEGRATFANTLKYVYMATSANFGNMFSMAGASLFLPFLPLLPKQILLMNLLTDFPEMTIATDSVDDGIDGRTETLGYSVHSQFYASIRHAEFGVRLLDVWSVAFGAARGQRSVSHRLVPGIGDLGLFGRACGAQSETVLA